ncbi:histidine kinase [Sporocytophaga myxococcoides]|uniref:histidine kinase n=1 Tax=Sporocytophaga myxococcoides TaxID=153721 RepID=UPI000422AD16|nr:histidine kinase [Sporocytophaga myxococcoides]
MNSYFFNWFWVFCFALTANLALAQNVFEKQLLLDAQKDLQLRKFAQALDKARIVYDNAIAKEDTVLKGESSFIIGKVFQKNGSYLVALEYLFTSLKIFDKNVGKKSEVLKTLGDLYHDWGGYKKGLEYYKLADSTSIDAEFKKDIKEAEGDIYSHLNQADLALVEYDKAIALSSFKDVVFLQRIYKKKSDIFLKRHDYDNALSMEFKQFDLVTNSVDQHTKATILNNIGYLYNFKSDNEKALVYFKKSKNTSIETGDTDSLYITLINIGAIYNIRKDLDSSLMALNEALKVVSLDRNKEKEATVRNYLAATLLEFKKYSEASDNNRIAIDLIKNSNNLSLLAQCYYIRSKIMEQKGKTKEQKYYYDQYKKLNDSLSLISTLFQNRQAEVDSLISTKESKIQQLLLNKEIDNLVLKQYKLLSEQREKDIVLLAQQNSLQKMALNNEMLNKDRLSRMWLLTQKELENERKAHEISELQKSRSEQDLLTQKTAVKLNKLAKENLQNELDIEKQRTELNKSAQERLWIIFGFSGGLALIFLAFGYYSQRKNARESQLKFANLEIQQRLLRSQMNPHFLFNSLNSIQGFINSNNSDKANRFLACYARLMRSILENTSKEMVSLHSELEALKSYIELEQMRLGNSFTYQIEVKDIESDMIAIPPMLIQPYVENSIMHGLRHKASGGLLKISIFPSEGFLNCYIYDNGIGREASKVINESRSKDYKSVAMNLTRDRLELLNAKDNSNMEVGIRDEFTLDGNPSGTTVILKLQLVEYV